MSDADPSAGVLLLRHERFEAIGALVLRADIAGLPPLLVAAQAKRRGER